jgi:hypothetical protein
MHELEAEDRTRPGGELELEVQVGLMRAAPARRGLYYQSPSIAHMKLI